MKRDFIKSVDRLCEAVAKDNLLGEGALRLVAVTGEMCLFSVTESRKVLGTFRIPIRQVSTSRIAGLLHETLASALPTTSTHVVTGGGADLGEEETDEGLATTQSLNKDGDVGQIDQKWVRTKYLAQLDEPQEEDQLEEPPPEELHVVKEADEAPEVPNTRLFVYDPGLADPIIRKELFGEDVPFEIAQMDDFVLANHISPAGEPTLTIHMDKGSKVVGLILTLTKDQINVADHHMDKYARIIYPVAGKQVFVYFMRQEAAPAAAAPVVESFVPTVSATFEPRQVLVFEAKDGAQGSELAPDGKGGYRFRFKEQMGSEQGFDGGTAEPATASPLGRTTGVSTENLAGSDGEHRMGVTPPGDLNKATDIHYSSGLVRESTEETSHLCKAVFLAGGPGSGKSTAADMMFNIQLRKDQLPTYARGVRIVNPDDMLELLAAKPDLQKSFADLKAIPAKVYELKPADMGGDMDSREVQNTLRPVTKSLMKRLAKGFFTMRQPIVIDGTGRHYPTIEKQKAYLKSLGYDCSMVYVDVALDVAIKRNRARARSVPDDFVRQAHEELTQHREKYRRLFGNRYHEIESGQTSYEDLRALGDQILDAPLKNPDGKEWLTIHALVQQQVEETILRRILEDRDYAREYKNYHGTPKQCANRNNRNKARRKMELETGDDREVDHSKPLSLGGTNHKNNLKVVTFAQNRSKGSKYEAHDANDEFVSGTMGTKDYKAAVAVIVKDDTVLLGLARADDDRDGKWCFPGGGIDPQDGGDPLLAARREAYEEAGVSIIPHSILDHPDKPGVAFVASFYSSGQPEPNEEFTSLQWVPILAAREDFPNVYAANRHILWRLSPGLSH